MPRKPRTPAAWRAAVEDGEAVLLDGRMLRHEWLETAEGFVKSDALDHHDDHFFPGPQDHGLGTWAAFSVEFSLDAAGEAHMLACYSRASGDRGRCRAPAFLSGSPGWPSGTAMPRWRGRPSAIRPMAAVSQGSKGATPCSWSAPAPGRNRHPLHPMSEEQKPIVCVDLDGVLNAFDGWRGAEFFHDPRPGARAFLKSLCDQGYSVVVFTVRWGPHVEDWLARHGLAEYVTAVTDKKPAGARLYRRPRHLFSRRF